MSRFNRRLTIGVVIFVLVLGGLVAFRSLHGVDLDDDGKPPASPSASPSVGVTLQPEDERKLGISVAALGRRRPIASLQAFGALELDPTQSFTVRAPLAGTVLAMPGRPWPDLGSTLPPGDRFGTLMPRLTPIDRTGLTTQLATAEADRQAAEASARASQAALWRIERLNAAQKNMSDQAVQDARARAAADQARLTGARKSQEVLETTLRGQPQPGGGTVLRADRGGQVIALDAQPGEAIEAGQPIMQLARFDRLIARINLPVGATLPRTPATARLVVSGDDAHPLTGHAIALAPAVDPQTQGQVLLYRVQAGGRNLRPGLAVTAELPASAAGATGLLIPPSAILQYEGENWVYLETQPHHFERRLVSTAQAVSEGESVTQELHPGARVVVVGASTLLARELMPQSPVGGGDGDD